MPIPIRPLQDNDIEEAVAIRNRVAPDSLPLTCEDLRHEINTTPERARSHQFAAEYDDHLAAFSTVGARWWTDDLSRFALDLMVDPPLQGRGIGAGLYRVTEDAARAEGAVMIFTWVRETSASGNTFAEHRGYVPTGLVERFSRLHVPTARFDALAEGTGNESIRLVSLSELGAGEETLRQLYILDETTAKDMPSSDTWAGSSYPEWKSHVFGAPGVVPDAFWIALDGDRTVGLTWLAIHGTTASTGYTGVDRAYRGRGIARALKARVTRWARDAGIEWIYTSNSARNAGMLKINVALGFQFLPAEIEMVKELR